MSRPSLRIRHRRVHRLWPVTIVAAMTALALTGCQPGALAPADSAEPSSSASEQPTETPGETTAPGETEAPEQTETPEVTTPPVAGDLPCSDVFTADQLYEFNPNFAPTTDQGTLPGAIAEIAEAGGTVCVYQHVTGADRLVIGVLQEVGDFTAPEFETVGDPDAPEGVATSTTGSAVISVASIYFPNADSAQTVIDQVAGNLG